MNFVSPSWPIATMKKDVAMIRVEHTSVKVRVPPSRYCAFVGNLVNTCNAMVPQTLNPSCIISMRGRRNQNFFRTPMAQGGIDHIFIVEFVLGASLSLSFLFVLCCFDGVGEDKVQSSVASGGARNLRLGMPNIKKIEVNT